jgi:hypothetical protein
MVAAFLELHHNVTAIASLPALLLCRLDKRFRLGILWTFTRGVHLLRTDATHSGLALLAAPNFAAILHANVMRFDPSATTPSRTVHAILSLVFLKFAVPERLEFVVEELLDVFEVDVLVGTAPGRHMGGVGHGHVKDALEARVAHAVLAWQEG